jgi:hypothetical protein
MDDQIAGAYGFAALSLQIAILNAFVAKGLFTTAEIAEVTALAASSVESAVASSSTPEMTQVAQQCLQGIAESWARRAQGQA